MTLYRIYSRDSGVFLGAYEAESPDDAFEELARDAGYWNLNEAARTLGLSYNQLLNTLEVEPNA